MRHDRRAADLHLGLAPIHLGLLAVGRRQGNEDLWLLGTQPRHDAADA